MYDLQAFDDKWDSVARELAALHNKVNERFPPRSEKQQEEEETTRAKKATSAKSIRKEDGEEDDEEAELELEEEEKVEEQPQPEEEEEEEEEDGDKELLIGSQEINLHGEKEEGKSRRKKSGSNRHTLPYQCSYYTYDR